MPRDDYAHWNEDADYMWWNEEGKHADDISAYYCDLCGMHHGGDCEVL